MLRRFKLQNAGAGESNPGKFVHTPPNNAPRYDLRKPKHLPDPMLEIDDPMLEIDDPLLELDGPQLSVPSSIAAGAIRRP